MITRSGTFLKFNNSCWNKQTTGVILGEGRRYQKHNKQLFTLQSLCVGDYIHLSRDVCGL